MSNEYMKPQDGQDEFISLGEFLAFAERWRTTILATTMLTMAFATAYTLTRTPVYRASATLRLEQDGQGSGPLADLALLTSAPAAESEIALLKSRSLAEEVITSALTPLAQEKLFPLEEHAVIGPEYRDRATVVQPDSLSPLSSLVRQLSGKATTQHRLYVAIDGQGEGATEDFQVEFLGPGTVRLSRSGFMGFSTTDAIEYDYVPGRRIEFGGQTVRLLGTGDFGGQLYSVSRDNRRDAVASLMSHTTVHETSRNSGVLTLTVEDGDPQRAAESVNALAQIYFLRSVRLGSSRAERTLGFVDTELERVLKQLQAAEQEVVELSAQHARAINVSATSSAMIDALAKYEGERVRVQLARRSVTEARDQIDAGNLRGLALLGPNLPDPMTISHIQAIGELRAAAAGLQRSDAGAYKMLLQRNLGDLRAGREQQAIQVRNLAQTVEAIASGDKASLTLLGGDNSSVDPIAMRYLEEIAVLDGELARYQQIVTEKHPDLSSRITARTALVARLVTHGKTRLTVLKGALAETDALIKSHATAIEAWSTDERDRIDVAASRLVALVRENLTSQLEGFDLQEASLDEAIETLEQDLASLPEHERQLADPMRRRQAFNGIAQILLESQQQAQLARAATMPSAVMIDPAVAPVRRSSPRVLTNIGVALLMGLLMGLGLSWLRNALSDSLHTQASLEEATDMAVLGSIPDFRHGKLRARCSGKDFLPMRDDPHGAVAESFRSIRESLRFALEGGERARTFAATSCVSNEGKTLVNINMSLAFAGGGRRVLLVDADMRSPSVGEYFSECHGAGFAEALEGKQNWSENIKLSGVEGLDLLPAGRAVGSPNDLLRTSDAVGLLEEFKAAYDHVVFDLPPALLVSDVETFADKFDAVTLVYRSSGVARGMLIRTVQRLRRSGVKLSGVVLNFVHASSSDTYGYGDGYGYGRGYGEDSGAESSQDQRRRSG